MADEPTLQTIGIPNDKETGSEQYSEAARMLGNDTFEDGVPFTLTYIEGQEYDGQGPESATARTVGNGGTTNYGVIRLRDADGAITDEGRDAVMDYDVKLAGTAALDDGEYALVYRAGRYVIGEQEIPASPEALVYQGENNGDELPDSWIDDIPGDKELVSRGGEDGEDREEFLLFVHVNGADPREVPEKMQTEAGKQDIKYKQIGKYGDRSTADTA